MTLSDDITPAERTYDAFTRLLLRGAVGAACIVVLVLFLIT